MLKRVFSGIGLDFPFLSTTVQLKDQPLSVVSEGFVRKKDLERIGEVPSPPECMEIKHFGKTMFMACKKFRFVLANPLRK